MRAAAVVVEDDDRRALAGVSLVADEGGILEMATWKHLLVIAVGIAELLGVGFDPHFHSVVVAAAGVSDPENHDECSMFSRV